MIIHKLKVYPSKAKLPKKKQLAWKLAELASDNAKLNKNSAEMIRDASASAVSELSGVNMDDEAAQLIEYQQAYQASARVLQTARELFDTLIDRI